MSTDVKNDTAATARKCYGAATTALRKAYKDEFDALLTAEYEAAGITVNRRARGEAAAAKREAASLAAKERREARTAAKIAKLQVELDALVIVEPFVDADDIVVE